MISENRRPLLHGIHPLTPERWPDFESLFKPHGVTSGCWCMWWRLTRREFRERQGEGNRLAMKAIVESGEVPGLLCYRGGKPVGWCSVAPRERFPSLERSPILRMRDGLDVWSMVCFFIEKASRGRGVADELIRGAVEHVRRQGGKAMEAYPVIPKEGRRDAGSIYMGVPGLFEKAGFTECARPSESRLIMRRFIDPAQP